MLRVRRMKVVREGQVKDPEQRELKRVRKHPNQKEQTMVCIGS